MLCLSSLAIAVHPFVCALVHSFVCWFICSFFCPSIHPFIPPSICRGINSSIQMCLPLDSSSYSMQSPLYELLFCWHLACVLSMTSDHLVHVPCMPRLWTYCSAHAGVLRNNRTNLQRWPGGQLFSSPCSKCTAVGKQMYIYSSRSVTTAISGC